MTAPNPESYGPRHVFVRWHFHTKTPSCRAELLWHRLGRLCATPRPTARSRSRRLATATVPSSDTQNRLIDAKNRKRRTPPRTSTQNSQSISRITHTLGTPSQCFRFRKGRLRRLRLSKSRLRAPIHFCVFLQKSVENLRRSRRLQKNALAPIHFRAFRGNGWESAAPSRPLRSYCGQASTLLTPIPRVDSL